jgi:hypothetical protein
MRARYPVILLIVFLLFFTLGRSVYNWLWEVNAELLPPTATPTITIFQPPPSPDQISILILGVDSHTARRPVLESCWLFTFIPGSPELFLVGFPLDTRLSDAGRLMDYYNLGPTFDDSALFIQRGLYDLSSGGIKVQYQVVLDRAFLISNIDAFGGLRLDGVTLLSGSEVFALYDALPPDDHLVRAEFQRSVLQALTDLFRRQGWSGAEVQAFFDRYREYSADSAELLDIAQRVMPFTGVDFRVELHKPTPAP